MACQRAEGKGEYSGVSFSLDECYGGDEQASENVKVIPCMVQIDALVFPAFMDIIRCFSYKQDGIH